MPSQPLVIVPKYPIESVHVSCRLPRTQCEIACARRFFISRNHAIFLSVFFSTPEHTMQIIYPRFDGMLGFPLYPSLPRVSYGLLARPAHATFYDCRSQSPTAFSASPDPNKRTTRTCDPCFNLTSLNEFTLYAASPGSSLVCWDAARNDLRSAT